MILDAWGWCTGMTQRDGMGRDEGEGFRMGTCVYLWRIHVDVWQNQYNIVKFKKKKENQRHYFANKGPSSQGSGFSSGHVWM